MQHCLETDRQRQPVIELAPPVELPVPGRRSNVDARAVESDPLGLDDYRVLALRDTLGALAGCPELFAPTLSAADRQVARRALPAMSPATPLAAPAIETAAAGQAMWRAAERRAVTLYRRACEADAASPEDPSVEAALGRAGSGAPLPAELRRTMESALGISLARVRIHTDAIASDAARAVRSEAFTVGDDIFFAAGKFDPGSREGQKLLAHELAHVRQAQQGRTATAGGGTGIRVSQPGDALEHEADAVAERIDAPAPKVAAEPAAAAIVPAAAPAAAPVIQRKPVPTEDDPLIYIDDVTGERFVLLFRDDLHGGRLWLSRMAGRGLVYFYVLGPSTLYLTFPEGEMLEATYFAAKALVQATPDAFFNDEIFCQALASCDGSPAVAVTIIAEYAHLAAYMAIDAAHGPPKGFAWSDAFEAIRRKATALSAADLLELHASAMEIEAEHGIDEAISWLEAWSSGIDALAHLGEGGDAHDSSSSDDDDQPPPSPGSDPVPVGTVEVITPEILCESKAIIESKAILDPDREPSPFELVLAEVTDRMRGSWDLDDLAEMRETALEIATSEGLDQALEWLRAWIASVDAMTRFALRVPEDDGEATAEQDRDSELEAEPEREDEPEPEAAPQQPQPQQSLPLALVVEQRPAPWETLPDEVWQLIVWFVSHGNRSRLVSVRLLSRMLYSLAEHTSIRELWYGANSLRNNKTRWTIRTVQPVNPLTGRITDQRPGEYREGPCLLITDRLVQAMPSSLPSCMVGAVISLSGLLYITTSGIVDTRFWSVCDRVLGRGSYVAVATGSLGGIEEHGEGKKKRMSITGVKTYGKPSSATFFNHPKGTSPTNEVANAPPGSCALPQLFERCRRDGDIAKYVSERRFDPNGNANTTVDVLDWYYSDDEEPQVLAFGHGDSTPSCVNCRPLTETQLTNVGSGEAALLQQLHAEFVAHQKKDKQDRERKRIIDQELARIENEKVQRKEREEAQKVNQLGERRTKLCEQMRAVLKLGPEPASAVSWLDKDWDELQAALDEWIENRSLELAEDEDMEDASKDKLVLLLVKAIETLLHWLPALDDDSGDRIEINIAEDALFKMLGLR